MVGHSYRVDECPLNLHEIDGWHIATLYQCLHDGAFRWHLDIWLDLGRDPPPYPIGTPNPANTQVVCQFGEVHFLHDPSSISWVHHWWSDHACGTSHDRSHFGLAIPNQSNNASQISGSCQFLPQVRVITLPLSQVIKGGAKAIFFLSETQQMESLELKHHLCSTPVLALPDLQQPFEIDKYNFDYAISAILTQ